MLKVNGGVRELSESGFLDENVCSSVETGEENVGGHDTAVSLGSCQEGVLGVWPCYWNTL